MKRGRQEYFPKDTIELYGGRENAIPFVVLGQAGESIRKEYVAVGAGQDQHTVAGPYQKPESRESPGDFSGVYD